MNSWALCFIQPRISLSQTVRWSAPRSARTPFNSPKSMRCPMWVLGYWQTKRSLEESNHANGTSPNLGPRGLVKMILNWFKLHWHDLVLGAFEAQECRIVTYFISPPYLPPVCGSKVLSAVDYMRILKLYPRLHRRNSRFLGLPWTKVDSAVPEGVKCCLVQHHMVV